MIHKLENSDLDGDQFSRLVLDEKSIANDHFDYSKVVVRKPWGYEYLIFSNAHVAVWILSLEPNSQTSMHCHPNKSTSLIVLQGEVAVSGLGTKIELKAGHGVFIDKRVFHQSTASSKSGAMLMEIETPVNKRDLVRLKDNYGRENLGYEGRESYTSNLHNYNYLSFKKFSLASGLTKNFLESSLNFINVTDGSIKTLVSKLNDEDILGILSGSILIKKNQETLQPGQIVKVNQLRDQKQIQVLSNLEFVVVRNNDHLIKLSDFVASFLVKKGVKKVYAVPGEANVHILDSIGRYDGLDYAVFQNEKSASYAAEAAIKLTNKPGILLVSSGASCINALQGFADAWVDSIPLIVISGQSRLDQEENLGVRQSGNKSVKIHEIVTPLAKQRIKVNDPKLISHILEEAWAVAQAGRPGPVWIDLPLDIQSALVKQEDLSLEIKKDNLKTQSSEKENEFNNLVKIVIEAKRPVILVGGGVRRSNAVSEFFGFAEKLGAPVLTSRQGADIFDNSHELYFGRPGGYGQRRANLIIQNCDVLISIGCRLTIPITGRNLESFARQSQKVIVDIDPLELSKSFLKDALTYEMDAKYFLMKVKELLPQTTNRFSGWLSQCTIWSERFPPNSYSGPSLMPDPTGPAIYPIFLMDILSNLLANDDIIVSDSGATLIYITLGMRFKSGQRFICSTGLEPIGFSLPASIGVAIESKCNRVICICDDRALQNALGDLRLIRDYQLPIKILVLKKNGNSIIRNVQRDFFGGRFIGTDYEINHAISPLGKIAELYGIELFEAANMHSVSIVIDQWLSIKKSAILMVDVADDQDRIPRPGFKFTEDLQWHPMPLEEQLPELERSTLTDNMIIDLVDNS